MKIIMGFVPNHVYCKHPYFLEAQKDDKSKYYKWFIFHRWPDEYEGFLGMNHLVKLNLEYGPARKHLIDAAKYWLSLGIDGLRLDYAVGPSHNFWKAFRKIVKKDYPHAVLFGETWFEGINKPLDSVFKEYEGELDGVLDFQFQRLISEGVARKEYSRKALKRKLKRHLSKFPPEFFLVSFLDNHDMDRFLFQCGGDKFKLGEAAKIQFSYPGPKVIYYGTEIGMNQEKSMYGIKEGDLAVRQPMIWNRKNWDRELLKFYTEIIHQATKSS